MQIKFLIILLAFSIIFGIFCFAAGEEDLQLVVEHSFDGGQSYSKKGIATFRSPRSGGTFVSDNSLTATQLSQLQDLVSSEGYYMVRTQRRPPPVTADTVQSSSHYVYSYTKACLLCESHLTDVLTVNIDLMGDLVGLSVSTSVSHCSTTTTSLGSLANFNTSVELVQPITGPVPDTVAYIQKIEEEKAMKERGQLADNRSFFAKYWMYIVPVVVMMMFMQFADPNAARS